jgi:hypothetical protein
MKVLCPQGLHVGVFQGLDGALCHHTFLVPRKENPVEVHDGWEVGVRPKPSCVVSQPLDWNGDYDCVLVQSIQDWNVIPDKNRKPIIYYDLMNGRGSGPSHIYSHTNTLLAFVSNSCRISHGIWDQVPHYVLYPGVNEDSWDPDQLPALHRSSKEQIIHTRNDFSKRDTARFNEWLSITTGMPHLLIGRDGDRFLNLQELVEEYITSRVYVNLEIATSTFSIAAMEAMMAGMPIVSNNIEGSADYIRNGMNGFATNNIDLMRRHTQDLMNDRAMAIALGDEARKTAIQMFGKKQFNASINYLFDNLNAFRRS